MITKLSTHVLDTANGIPAHNMNIELYALNDRGRTSVVVATTNADGRTDMPLLANETMKKGIYEICFFVSDYFQKMKRQPTACPFLDIVPVRFSITEDDRNYHVPLLVSPWSYSTYRGS
ncbi:MAG: 5-hydroxyisourate hydrolase [Candidatus Tokpelaia sp. JSC188]|nr:MAG: 5-hydroxyisourate hydrolase [Candidatus Tokpelaia sp. JSC188]